MCVMTARTAGEEEGDAVDSKVDEAVLLKMFQDDRVDGSFMLGSSFVVGVAIALATTMDLGTVFCRETLTELYAMAKLVLGVVALCGVVAYVKLGLGFSTDKTDYEDPIFQRN